MVFCVITGGVRKMDGYPVVEQLDPFSTGESPVWLCDPLVTGTASIQDINLPDILRIYKYADRSLLNPQGYPETIIYKLFLFKFVYGNATTTVLMIFLLKKTVILCLK